jgi:SAM-dependent methyltransferase
VVPFFLKTALQAEQDGSGCGSVGMEVLEPGRMPDYISGMNPDASAPQAGFWDDRYSKDEFAYGTEPNRWLAERAGVLPPGARVLCLGEGEGRNAVWLAQRGFVVDAVDGSQVGLAKAQRLAAKRGVRIGTWVGDLAAYRPEPGGHDAVVLVFVHLPPEIRARVHAAAAAALVPGGVVIVEAFTPRQLGRPSGGPRQADMLYDAELLRGDFPGVEWSVLEEAEVDLDEGPHHQGRAAVVRGVGRIVVRGPGPD